MVSLLLLLVLWLRGCQATVNEPELLWAYGGCTSWCQTGWYSSPAFFEDPSNSSRTVIAASTYSVYGIDAHTGDTLWTHDSSTRTWPGLVYVDDWDSDGGAIIAGKSNSQIVILDTLGQVKDSLELDDGYEFRSLAVGHFDGDSGYSILAGQTGDGLNTFVYDSSLSLKSGWPKTKDDEDGYSWGIYNDNLGLVDSDGNGLDDMIVSPSDVFYICAFDKNGDPITSNARYENKNWGKIGVWTNEFYDKQGWAYCSESTRPNFARSAVVNVPHPTEDSVLLAVAGNVYNCSTSPYTNLWFGPFVFGLDRSRPNVSVGDGVTVDWSKVPKWTGAPLSESYSVIENVNPNIAVGDLDGDGVSEMVYSSYDGRVHVFSLNDNSEEPWNWPYSVYDSSQGYLTYSSEPVIVDFDNDGFAEVVVATWPQKDFDATGDLIILAYDGTLLHKVPLPQALGGGTNGGLAAPTVGDIRRDDNGDVEIALLTIKSGLVLYTVPGTGDARILWGTGRGSFQRAGRTTDPLAPDHSAATLISVPWIALFSYYFLL